MPASRKFTGKPSAPAARRQQGPRLNPMMACDTAFRIIARRCLGDLATNHAATCRGDPLALHQMRIALTRLRTAITFFSPMVVDDQRIPIRHELKWLSTHLGTVRDLDVVIERLGNRRKADASRSPTLEREARAGHQLLARVLQSDRYRRLAKDTSAWVEHGSWSTAEGKRATQARACAIGDYSARKLTRWQRRLLERSRKLSEMGTEKRHRLRLRNKRLAYSVEFFEELFAGKDSSRQEVALKHLRNAQRSLGQLNDDATGQSLATASGAELSLRPLGRKRKKRLLESAATAYRKLAALKTTFTRDSGK
jgi:CHAD domain-containing protein